VTFDLPDGLTGIPTSGQGEGEVRGSRDLPPAAADPGRVVLRVRDAFGREATQEVAVR
jgi:hypothetical protein